MASVDATETLTEDSDMRFSCPNEVFHKRQFIMQIIVNFRDYDDRHEKNTMARKVSPKGCRK